MEIHYAQPARLSEEAQRLVEFDVASLRQLLASRQESEPAIWLASPEGYQDETHVLRDSPSIRLIAYADRSSVIYATDGCNACSHALETSLDACGQEDMERLSESTQLPEAMLEALKHLLGTRNA